MDSGRVPVIVGVGQVVQRPRSPGAIGPLDAVGLMLEAARRAGEDSTAPALLTRPGLVLVAEGTWPAGDAGRAVAMDIGADAARTVLARVGVLQTTLLARAATAIAAGEVDVALVVGGEAKASAAAAARAGSPVDDRGRSCGPADVELAPHGEIVTGLEIERGLAMPVQSYALQEQALRHHRGETVAVHRQRLAALWAGFAAIAATNPFAWDPTAAAAATAAPAGIADPSAPGNRMVSTPYTKRHCSQWNVDQAVAIILCAADVADAAGIPPERRVHPLVVIESNAMVPVSRRADLHRSPAIAVLGRRLAGLGWEPSAVRHLDLYSCFPSAVQIQAAELGIDLDRRLTVTGGMGFAGGPLNSAALHGVATMVDVLRADPGATGLVTAISGMLTKQGACVLAVQPPADAYRAVDVTDDAFAATAQVDVDGGYVGEAVVEGATVAFDGDGPALAVVVGRASHGRRAVASSTDRDVAAALAEDPRCGDAVGVEGPTITRW